MKLVKLFNFAVVVIGVYMVAAHISGGVFTPPVLSGIAFILLGSRPFVR